MNRKREIVKLKTDNRYELLELAEDGIYKDETGLYEEVERIEEDECRSYIDMVVILKRKEDGKFFKYEYEHRTDEGEHELTDVLTEVFQDEEIKIIYN